MVVTEDWSFRAEAVSKVYDGTNRANDQVTLRVEPGEVYGLLGPNGAGKTTLVKQVIGLLKPTGGRITLGPYDMVAEPDAARQLCSYLPQAQMPIDSFRVHEAIELTGRIRGGHGATSAAGPMPSSRRWTSAGGATPWASSCQVGSSGWWALPW